MVQPIALVVAFTSLEQPFPMPKLHSGFRNAQLGGDLLGRFESEGKAEMVIKAQKTSFSIKILDV
jgi:hypothetical protein